MNMEGLQGDNDKISHFYEEIRAERGVKKYQLMVLSIQ